MSVPLSDLAILQYVTNEYRMFYEQNVQNFLADMLAPRVGVDKDQGKWFEDDDSGNLFTDARRAPGAPAGEVTSGVIDGVSYQTQDYTLKEKVTDEDLRKARTEFGLDVYQMKAQKLATRGLIQNDRRVIALYRSLNWETWAYDATLGVYESYGNQVSTLTGVNRWDSTSADPFGNIETAKEWFAENTVIEPNVIIIPDVVGYKLRETTAWKAEYGTRDLFAETGPEAVTMIRGLKPLIAKAKFKSTIGGAWVPFMGTDCWIGRVEPYSAQYKGLAVRPTLNGGKQGITVWRDGAQDTNTAYVQAHYGEDDVIQTKSGGSESGYLLRTVIS